MLIASGAGNVPPHKSLFSTSFEDPEESSDDLLSAFDYEAFLRREGLS